MTLDEETTLPRSFLIADIGNTNTTVSLFDVAGGSYRLIASASSPTTAREPWSDVRLGVQYAIQHIVDTTGRPLLNDRGGVIRPARGNGTGVDQFAATISAAPPLKTITVSLSDQVSLASARRALHRAYAYEADSFSLLDQRSEAERIVSIVEQQPDLFFLTGGTDGGAEEQLLQLVETVHSGIGAMSEISRPQIVFAGNKNLREHVRTILGENAKLYTADNVRPTLDTEQLDDAGNVINTLYETIKVSSVPNIQGIRDWSNQSLTPTAQSLAGIVSYFATLQDGQVMGVDLGSDSVTAVFAKGDQTAYTVKTDAGIGRSATRLLTDFDQVNIGQWLPTAVDDKAIRNYVYNKSLFPQTVPMTEFDLRLEQALAREILRCLLRQAYDFYDDRYAERPLRLLLARGNTLTNAPRPGQALLILLDTLQPTGIFSVALDVHGILPALGVLAQHEPLGAVQALEGGVLQTLGWVVAPSGNVNLGQKALNVIMESDEINRLEVEVISGTIEVLPLAPGKTATVTLEPARRLDVGEGPGKAKQVTIHGGTVGVVIDARGRPMQLPEEDEARQESLRQWLWDVGG